ncbi:MAG: hypothetical protein ACYDH5_06625 [Acidimicrobiales bacterium]
MERSYTAPDGTLVSARFHPSPPPMWEITCSGCGDLPRFLVPGEPEDSGRDLLRSIARHHIFTCHLAAQLAPAGHAQAVAAGTSGEEHTL